MADGRILLKPWRNDSFKKSYRMSLISAGSISLDSTFKSDRQALRLPNDIKIKWLDVHEKHFFKLRKISRPICLRLWFKKTKKGCLYLSFLIFPESLRL
jgi:hypothetical protein